MKEKMKKQLNGGENGDSKPKNLISAKKQFQFYKKSRNITAINRKKALNQKIGIEKS